MLASLRARPEVGLPLLGGPRRPQRKPRASERSKFQANIVTSKRTTVSYVSCGTHPAAWPRRKPRPSVCPEGCPAMGRGLGNPHGLVCEQRCCWGLRLGNKRMRERFLAELRLKPP